MKRKTIGINKGLKSMVKHNIHEGETVDSFLNRLMDESDEMETVTFDSDRSNLTISEDTYNRLLKYRLFSTESHISVIFRLISEKGKSD